MLVHFKIWPDSVFHGIEFIVGIAGLWYSKCSNLSFDGCIDRTMYDVNSCDDCKQTTRRVRVYRQTFEPRVLLGTAAQHLSAQKLLRYDYYFGA